MSKSKMADLCCVCAVDVSCGTKKAKRKLLNGRTATRAREVLNELLLEEHDLLMDNLSHFKSEKVFICLGGITNHIRTSEK